MCPQLFAPQRQCVCEGGSRLWYQATCRTTPTARFIWRSMEFPASKDTFMHVEDEGQLYEALPRGDVGDVHHPDPVRSRGDEVTR